MQTDRCGQSKRAWKRGLWLKAGYVIWLFLWALPRPAEARTASAVLVLNVADGGRPHEALRLQVSDFLRRAGARLVEPPRLSAATRSCEESSCLNSIAERHRVDYILAARIDHHGSRDRILYMWLYDANSGHDQSERIVCDSIDLEERLREVAGRLFGPHLQVDEKTPAAPAGTSEPEPAPRVETPPPEPAPAPAAAAAAVPAIVPPPDTKDKPRSPLTAVLSPPPPPPRRMPLLGPRARAALVLGILTAGALAVAIPLNARSGMRVSGEGAATDDKVYSYQPIYIPLYATAGALAVSTALTLTWPTKKEVRK